LDVDLGSDLGLIDACRIALGVMEKEFKKLLKKRVFLLAKKHSFIFQKNWQ